MKHTLTLVLVLFALMTSQGQVQLNVGDNFQNIIDTHPAGTTFIIKSGLHRMQTILAREGDSYLGELDANGTRLSTMRGSQILTGFTSGTDGIGEYWMLSGQIGDNFIYDLGTCDDGKDCHRAEDIFIDCLPLKQVTSMADMDQADECFINGSDVYIRTNPANRLVEASVNKFAIHAEQSPNGGPYSASNVTVKNLIIEQYANPAQHGAINAAINNQNNVPERNGINWLIENNEVRYNHGTGIYIYTDGIMKNNVIHHNGQIGMKGSGIDITIQDNLVFENGDWGGYKWSWEGGGSKFVRTTNLQMTNNYCYDNYGPGLWTDIDNIDPIFENNICENNLGPGIFHEISFGGTISCNTLIGNQYSLATGQWYGGNVFISNSSDVEVLNNTITCSGTIRSNAVMLMCDDRFSSSTGLPYFTRNNHIYDNEINFLDEANLTGLIMNNPGCDDFSGNVFENNKYHALNPAFSHFQWGGYGASANGDLSFMNGIPQDIGSTIDSNLNTNNACNVNTPDQYNAECNAEVKAQVEVEDGDVYLTNACHGIILTSPCGRCFRVTVGDEGELETALVVCP